MKRKMASAIVIAISFTIFLYSATSHAQPAHFSHYHHARPWAANVIIPQSRAFSESASSQAQITEVEVGVVILEQVAVTTMDIGLKNPTRNRIEAELLVPVPEGASIRGFAFQGTKSEATAKLLSKAEAKGIYHSLVSKIRDPALLEFDGYSMVRSSVFPLEAKGTQRVRLTYEHILTADGPRVDYILPRSESLDVKAPWTVRIKIKNKSGIATVYSPTHELKTKNPSKYESRILVGGGKKIEPGPFHLCYLREGDELSASLMAYPDPSAGGGYFLLIAGLPTSPPKEKKKSIKREVTLIIDKSGSMNGEKLNQAKKAAIHIVESLENGESFNIIAYNEAVDAFANAPVIKSNSTLPVARSWIENIKPRGGTNIHDALLEALRQKPIKGTLPIVLFMTDGLPTIGKTKERVIRDLAVKGNPHGKRVFTFGVGPDVNTPLLKRIADESRGTSTFVVSDADVKLKISKVFKQLSGPALSDTAMRVIDKKGRDDPGRTQDLIPARLPDLFEGDQLILLGRYVGERSLGFEISGELYGKNWRFNFRFDLDKATTRNSFVPRLWASRKIALLADAIRQAGADHPSHLLAGDHIVDPKLKELIDEAVKLSTEFGVLTEYTAFLAEEGTDLALHDEILAEANFNFGSRALKNRSGFASLNQEANLAAQSKQGFLNRRNEYLDRNLNRIEVANVRQSSDRTFFKRRNRWVDGRIAANDRDMEPKRSIDFGSPEYFELASKLVEQNRQSIIAVRGDILMEVEGEKILVKGPKSTNP